MIFRDYVTRGKSEMHQQTASLPDEGIHLLLQHEKTSDICFIYFIFDSSTLERHSIFSLRSSIWKMKSSIQKHIILKWRRTSRSSKIVCNRCRFKACTKGTRFNQRSSLRCSFKKMICSLHRGRECYVREKKQTGNKLGSEARYFMLSPEQQGV